MGWRGGILPSNGPFVHRRPSAETNRNRLKQCGTGARAVGRWPANRSGGRAHSEVGVAPRIVVEREDGVDGRGPTTDWATRSGGPT